ncbi:MAG: PAS domain S-box protein [Deltaproteobacteria bacterium]
MSSDHRGRTVGTRIVDDMDPVEKLILRSMNEGVITIECNGDIYTVNPAALRLLGSTEEELIGKNFDEVLSHSPRNEEFSRILSKVIHEGHPTDHQEVRFTRNDGQTLDLSVATAFLQVDECLPHMQNVVVVFRDITAFKAMERVRRRAVDHLSHELKTPLAIIEASVDHLGTAESSPALMSKSMERIKRNLNRLKAIQEIVEEILNPRPFRPRRFDTASTVEGILDEIRRISSRRSVELISNVEPVEIDVIDPDVLAIVIESLVKNAIENTPDQGTIVVSLKPVSVRARNSSLSTRAGRDWSFCDSRCFLKPAASTSRSRATDAITFRPRWITVRAASRNALTWRMLRAAANREVQPFRSFFGGRTLDRSSDTCSR